MKKILALTVALALALSAVPLGVALAAGEIIELFDITKLDITANDGDETALDNYGWTASGDATQGSQSNLRFSLHWANDGEIKGTDKKALTVFDSANDSTDRTVVASIKSASYTAGTEKLVFDYSWGMRCSDKTDNYQSWSFLDLDGKEIARTYIDVGTATDENGGNAQFKIGVNDISAVVSQGSGSRDKVIALRAVPFRVEVEKQEDGTFYTTYSCDDDGDGVYTKLHGENVGIINGFKSISTWIGGWSNQWAAMGLMDLKISYKVESAADVTVKTVFSDGTDSNIPDVVYTVQADVEYEQPAPADTVLKIGDAYYIFNEESSTLKITPVVGGENIIKLVYDKYEGTGLTGSVISEEGATCWFADPRSLTVKNDEKGVNKTYVGYIDVHGSVKALQYDNKTGEYDEILIRSNFQPDDHNNPTFLELPDGRIMIFYSRHTDEACFYYRVSKQPYDITTLGEEKYLKTTNNTTYPNPFILSADPEHIYLCWRGINWHPTIGRITIPDENGDVTLDLEKQIVQSTGARPYAKYTSNGVDEIWVTYTTGHPDNENPNWLYFNKIKIPSLDVTDINDKVVSNVNQGTLSVNKTDSTQSWIVDSPSSDRDWVWEITSDENGTPVIAMVKIDNGKTNHNYYCTSYVNGKWQNTFLTYAGGKFHSSSTEYCYSGGMTIDKTDPHIFYCSIPVKGVYGSVFEIVKYTLNEDYTAIEKTEYITENSRENNVRPYISNGSTDGDLRLTWMNGQYYYWMVNQSYPKGFPTRMMTLTDLAEPELKNTLGDGSDAYSIDGNTETVSVPSSDSFTISMELFQGDISVGGTLLKSGNLEIDLEKQTVDPMHDYAAVAPKVTAGGKTQKSDNLFSDSDWFAESVKGTDGDKGESSMGWINYTVTYDAGTRRLVTYVNGLIDANLQDVDATLDETAEIGGISGIIANVRTADVALTQAEVKAAAEDFDSDSINILNTINLGDLDNVTADFLLPSTTVDGQALTWSSNNEDVLTKTGAVIRDGDPHTVELTAATQDGKSRVFTINVAAKESVTENLLFRYDFSEAYTDEDGVVKVPDVSGNGLDGVVYGSAKLDGGKLDLTANTATDFSTNGYVNVPYNFLDGVRSYTVIQKVRAGNTTQPRFYDFGRDNQNSMFTRVDAFTAGIKYDGSTVTVKGSTDASISSDVEQWVATTYSAATGKTSLYIDGKLITSDDEIKYEPYQISGSTDRNYIGRTQWWDTGYRSDNQDFNGTIDSFMFFNAALTENEIVALTTPSLTASLGWNKEKEAFTIDFLLDSALSGKEYTFTVKGQDDFSVSKAVTLTDSSRGISFETTNTTRLYKAAAGAVESGAASVYGLVVRAIIDGGFGALKTIDESQVTAANKVLNDGGIYLVSADGGYALPDYTSELMTLTSEGDVYTVTLTDDAYDAGLRFSAISAATEAGSLTPDITEKAVTIDLAKSAAATADLADINAALMEVELVFAPEAEEEAASDGVDTAIDFEEIL